MKVKIFIPNAITATNLSLGLVAVFAMAFFKAFDAAFYCILMAALFDMFDGLVARALKAETSFGKEFDSLSDYTSFGLAPALLLLFKGGMDMENITTVNAFLGILPSIIYALAAAIRLAWFNTDESQSVNFKGLASPAAAILVFSTFIYWNCDCLLLNPLFVACVSAALMLVPLKVTSLKFNKGKSNLILSILMILISIISILLFGLKVIPFIIIFYYVFGAVLMLVAKNS